MKFSRILVCTALLGTTLLGATLKACSEENIMLAPKEIIDDYLEIADNYAFSGDYQKALDYINMVAKFEPMNPTVKYKQALFLTTLNKNAEAREIFAQALKLNPKFANSELAYMLAKSRIVETMPLPANLPSQTTSFVPRQNTQTLTQLPTQTAPQEQAQISTQEQIQTKPQEQTQIQEQAQTQATQTSTQIAELPLKPQRSKNVIIPDSYLPKEMQKQTRQLQQTQKIQQEELSKQEHIAIPQKESTVFEENPTVLKAEVPQPEVKPYSSEYYNQLALQYLNDGNNKQAYEYLKKAIELDKKNFEAVNNLGLFYWQQGENKLAEQEFKKAARINPTSTKPLLNIGLLYKEMEKDKKYYNYINKALKLDPNDYLANWVVGNYYAETGRPKHAIKLYQKAIDSNQSFYDGYISLGNILASTQKFKEAYEVYKKALSINSLDPNLYYVLSKTASILDSKLEAKEYILCALELAENEKYFLELAKVASNMGDYEESLEILMKYFSNTTDPEILNYIGLAYYKIKQPEIAIKYFNKLIEIEKSKTIYYYNLALCYKSLGDRDKFFNYVDKATKILPKEPQDYIDLSYIYFDNGNKSFAINVLNDGILKFPNSEKLYQAKLSLFKTCNDTKNYMELKTTIDEKFGSMEE